MAFRNCCINEEISSQSMSRYQSSQGQSDVIRNETIELLAVALGPCCAMTAHNASKCSIPNNTDSIRKGQPHVVIWRFLGCIRSQTPDERETMRQACDWLDVAPL